MITQEFILKWHGTIPQKAMEDVIRLVENERARTIDEIGMKLCSEIYFGYEVEERVLEVLEQMKGETE